MALFLSVRGKCIKADTGTGIIIQSGLAGTVGPSIKFADLAQKIQGSKQSFDDLFKPTIIWCNTLIILGRQAQDDDIFLWKVSF